MSLNTIERILVDYFEAHGFDPQMNRDGSNEWMLDTLEHDDISLTALAVAIQTALAEARG